MTLKHSFVLIIATITLSGCLSPINSTGPSTYVLNTVPSHLPHKPATHATIFVAVPETRPVYNTTQMAYTDKPYQVSYFGKNQWAETPAQMLMPLIVQTLQNTHHFHAVVTTPFTGRFNYILSTQILKIQQDFTHHPTMLELTIRAQLIRTSSNQVIATKQFSSRIPIRQNSPYSGVIAANQATAHVLRDIAEFCLQYTY